jgi:glycosyltransferase involved in cell wall biosynthesis
VTKALQISVVIPTYRRVLLLRRCLDAVLAQRFEPGGFEIIVVDDGHTDDTRALVAELASRSPVQLHYLRPAQGRGPAVARNCGWRAARAPLVAFTDDDTVPLPDWLAAGEATLRESGVVAACGRVVVPRVHEPPTDHELMTRGLETAEFVTANAFVRRDALEQVMGFDERFLRAWREDSDLQFRLARLGEVRRSEQAVVLHPVRPERWGVSLRQQHNTFFDALLYKKHPRLYRERIRPEPPWGYYAIVGCAVASTGLALAGAGIGASAFAAMAATLVARLARARLLRTRRTREHVLEMVATSALIPFLSVYWRLRGAWHYRVFFL